MTKPFEFSPVEREVMNLTLAMAEVLRGDLPHEARKEIMELLLMRDSYAYCLLDVRFVPNAVVKYATDMGGSLTENSTESPKRETT